MNGLALVAFHLLADSSLIQVFAVSAKLNIHLSLVTKFLRTFFSAVINVCMNDILLGTVSIFVLFYEWNII